MILVPLMATSTTCLVIMYMMYLFHRVSGCPNVYFGLASMCFNDLVAIYGVGDIGQPRWRHQMETFSASLALCAGNSPVTSEFPTQRPVTRGFDVLINQRLNKRLSKQSRDWWFATPSGSLWRHHNDTGSGDGARTNIELPSTKSSGIPLRVMFAGILSISIHKLCLKFTHLKSLPHLPEENDLTFTQFPDSEVHVTNMGPTWVLSAPGGPHADPMNFAIREAAALNPCTPVTFREVVIDVDYD